jgi:hypothetical protein
MKTRIVSDVETQLNEEAQHRNKTRGDLSRSLNLSAWDWNLDNLITIGFEEDKALEILSEYHQWIEDRKKTADGTWFRGIWNYLYIHYQVILKFQFPTAPYKAIRIAAWYMANSQEGEDKYDKGMREIGLDVGLNMMRYRVWDGDKHRDAYIEFLKRFKKFKGENKKSIKARNEIIEEMNLSE